MHARPLGSKPKRSVLQLEAALKEYTRAARTNEDSVCASQTAPTSFLLLPEARRS